MIYFISLFSSVCMAVTPIYDFESEAQQKNFVKLTQELRCVVCQGQSLAESNAPLAQDIKNIIYNMILHKNSQEEIKTYIVERYGDSVLYKPPLNKQTLILWLFPFFMLVIVLIGLPVWVLKRQKSKV